MLTCYLSDTGFPPNGFEQERCTISQRQVISDSPPSARSDLALAETLRQMTKADFIAIGASKRFASKDLCYLHKPAESLDILTV